MSCDLIGMSRIYLKPLAGNPLNPFTALKSDRRSKAVGAPKGGRR